MASIGAGELNTQPTKFTEHDSNQNLYGLFRLPLYWLLILLVLQIVFRFLWVLQHPIAGNLGGVLLALHGIVLLAYVFVTPVLGIIYSHRYYVENIAPSSVREKSEPVPRRFWLHMVVWLVIAGYAATNIVRALDGEVPSYVRVKEGPDTTYARPGFERLLNRPVPAHVSGINFQNRNDIMDEHQILRFNTMEEEFIAGLIQDFELELLERRRFLDDKYEPVGRRVYFELYRLGPYLFYYNRQTGDAKFEWFAT